MEVIDHKKGVDCEFGSFIASYCNLFIHIP
jgi:hypothetical protein